MSDETFEKEAQAAYQSEMQRVGEAYAILTKDPAEYEEEHEDEEEPEDLDDLQERIRQEMSEAPLGSTTTRCVQLKLSIGGPASGYYLFYTDGGHGSWDIDHGFFWLDNEQLKEVAAAYNLEEIYE